MPTLHSHTHWQAPQADTQAQACQRVCLSHAEKKKLKIPFPSKNFKNAITQSDTKTFGQLAAKLNKDKGCKTQTTRTPACNRVDCPDAFTSGRASHTTVRTVLVYGGSQNDGLSSK